MTTRKQYKKRGMIITPDRWEGIKAEVDRKKKTMFIKDIADEIGYSKGCVGVIARVNTWQEYRAHTSPNAYSYIDSDGNKKVKNPNEFRPMTRPSKVQKQAKPQPQPIKKVEKPAEPVILSRVIEPKPKVVKEPKNINWTLLGSVIAVCITVIIVTALIVFFNNNGGNGDCAIWLKNL